MLLAVADEYPERNWLTVGVDDLTPVDAWMKDTTDGGTLDGVYLQYQKEMMTAMGAASLRQLSEEKGYSVGVWGFKHDPDDYETFQWLVNEGHCAFVNPDLPGSFRKDIMKKQYTA